MPYMSARIVLTLTSKQARGKDSCTSRTPGSPSAAHVDRHFRQQPCPAVFTLQDQRSRTTSARGLHNDHKTPPSILQRSAWWERHAHRPHVRATVSLPKRPLVSLPAKAPHRRRVLMPYSSCDYTRRTNPPPARCDQPSLLLPPCQQVTLPQPVPMDILRSRLCTLLQPGSRCGSMTVACRSGSFGTPSEPWLCFLLVGKWRLRATPETCRFGGAEAEGGTGKAVRGPHVCI